MTRLAGTNELQPFRWTAFGLQVLIGAFFIIGSIGLVKKSGMSKALISGNLWFPIGVGLVCGFFALRNLLTKHEVLLERSQVVTRNGSFSTAWKRYPLAAFDRVAVVETRHRATFPPEYAVELAGPKVEPVQLRAKQASERYALRAGAQLAATLNLPLEERRWETALVSIPAEEVKRHAPQLEQEDQPWHRIPAARGILIASLIPLFGVFFLRWDLLTALLVFWFDNLLIGLIAGVRIAMSSPHSTNPASGHAIWLFAYMAFTLFQAPFMFAFGDIARHEAGLPTPRHMSGWIPLLPWAQLAVAAAAVMASRLFELYADFIKPRAYLDGDADRHVPGGRMMAMHLGLLVAFGAMLITGAPVAGFAVLVAIKLSLDLSAYMEHYRGRASPALDALVGNRQPIHPLVQKERDRLAAEKK
jgi:hypothetical protein